MPLTAYPNLDEVSYRRDPESQPFSRDVPAGVYVFVQDIEGVVWVLPDGRHQHPRVLGGRRPAVAAGELTLSEGGVVEIINNISGTYACHKDCLLTAVGGLIMQGATITADAVSPWEM